MDVWTMAVWTMDVWEFQEHHAIGSRMAKPRRAVRFGET